MWCKKILVFIGVALFIAFIASPVFNMLGGGLLGLLVIIILLAYLLEDGD